MIVPTKDEVYRLFFETEETLLLHNGKHGLSDRSLVDHEQKFFYYTGSRPFNFTKVSLDDFSRVAVEPAFDRATQGLALSLDGSKLIASSRKNRFRIFDSKSLKPLTPEIRDRTGDDFEFLATGLKNRILTGSNALKIWDDRSGRELGVPIRQNSKLNPNLHPQAFLFSKKQEIAWVMFIDGYIHRLQFNYCCERKATMCNACSIRGEI